MSHKPSIILFCLVCLAGSSQLAPTELAQRIERRIRTDKEVPVSVKIVISSLRPSEFASYDAVTVTFDSDGRKQNHEFLLSKDQTTLVQLAKMDLSKDPYAENLRKIDVKGRPVRGNSNAKVVAVNYDDFQCPYCARVHQTLFPELLKEYGDRVAFTYKDFPLSEIHPWAVHAAVNANCLAAQSNDAYWDFADYIHANRQSVNGGWPTLLHNTKVEAAPSFRVLGERVGWREDCAVKVCRTHGFVFTGRVWFQHRRMLAESIPPKATPL